MKDLTRTIRLATAVLLAAAILAPALLFAGTTGKIAGTVTDASSGEPLSGVNIVVEGTRRGAATDLDGYYYIINLPPGTYTLRVSALGYAVQEITGVRVSVDKTTTINVQLRPEALEGEAVTIVAEKPIVEVDRTFASASVGDEELEVMPITRVDEAVQLQAGVVDGHFRGGRSGEVVYMIDGIPVQDVYDNTQATTVSQDVVKELQVISGTFNAEYGQAMSGVVNMVTKEGGQQYSGALGAHFGDYVSSHDDIFYNVDDLSPTHISDYNASLSGPVPFTENLSFYLNGRFEDNQGWLYGRRRFHNDFNEDPFQYFDPRTEDFQVWVDSLRQEGVDVGEYNQLVELIDWIEAGAPPEEAPDVNVADEFYYELVDEWARWDDQAVPMNYDLNLYLFGKLTYRFGETSKLNYISMWEDRDYKDFDRSFFNIPSGDYERHRRSRTNNLKLTSSLGAGAFWEAGYANTFTEYYHRNFENIFDPRYHYYDPIRVDNKPNYALNIQGYKLDRFRRFTNTHSFQGKLDWQVNPTHYIVTGANFSYNTVHYKNINDDITEVGPTILTWQDAPPSPGDYNYDTYTYHPLEAAFFLQDKIELDAFVMNVGARVDYFNSRGKVLADPKDPDVYHPVRRGVNPDGTLDPIGERLAMWYEDPSPKVQLSPRLGVGYPITDKGVLHFAYGHFFQRPRYEYLYANPEFEIELVGTGVHTTMGNADLEAEKTVSYELGFDQAINRDLSLGISMYQRDIRGLVTADRFVETYKAGIWYAQYQNKDIAQVRGFLLSLKKRYSNNFSASVDYTFQVAEGVASAPGDKLAAMDNSVNATIPRDIVPLDWDRRHTVNANFNYVIPQNWGVSLIGTIGSGLPYDIALTSESIAAGFIEPEPNSGRKPTYMNMDLNMFKVLNVIEGANVRLELMVRNLFDRLNENDVYGNSGTADYNLDFEDHFTTRYDFNSIEEFYQLNPQFYSRPREVRVGVSIEF